MNTKTGDVWPTSAYVASGLRVPAAATTSPRLLLPMTLTLRDGSLIAGTPLEIVREMQSHARGAAALTIPRYIDWVVANVRRFEEVDLEVGGSTDEERASALLSEMIRVGLATRA